jgi:hypothetical protein
MKTYHALIIGLILLTAAGCDGAAAVREPRGLKPDPVVTMLHQGVIELNENIEELKRDIADLERMPIPSDPQVQELQGLDLAAWQLHLQQWMLQRDRLVSSLKFIEQAQAAPQDKAALGSQWSEHQAALLKTIEELRTHRRAIEQKRIDVESQVLGQYFK